MPGGHTVQRINEFVDQLFRRFSQQSDTRRAAILGMMFGLLMCVVVMLAIIVLGFMASLGG